MNKHLGLFWIAASLVFGLDRLTKIWAEANLTLGESVPGINEWYEWTLYYNTGAAGGIFSGHLEFLITVSICAVLGMLWFMHKGDHDSNLWLQVGLGLMMGGALGNLFDRVFYHHVIDFINPIHKTYIYNIADKGIRWGLYLSLFGLFVARRRAAKRNRAPKSEKTLEG